MGSATAVRNTGRRLSSILGRRSTRGTGSAQYHPRMMLALLVYCYANGIFGSRRIERATYRDIGVRYVAANCHPDHDTICTFRRSNFEAVAAAFLQVLLLAKELQLLRVGTVSVDGTKVDANANKRNSIRYDRAGALREQLRGEIEGLLDQAEHVNRYDAEAARLRPSLTARRGRQVRLLTSTLCRAAGIAITVVLQNDQSQIIRQHGPHPYGGDPHAGTTLFARHIHAGSELVQRTV